MTETLKFPEVPFKLLKLPFIDWSKLYFMKSSYKFIIEEKKPVFYWRSMDKNIISLCTRIDMLCLDIYYGGEDDRKKYINTLNPHISFINSLPNLNRIPKNPMNKDYIIHLCVVYKFLYHNFITNRMNQDRLITLFDDNLTKRFYMKMFDNSDIALELWKENIPGSVDIPLTLFLISSPLLHGGKSRKKSIKTKQKYRKLTKRKLRR